MDRAKVILAGLIVLFIGGLCLINMNEPSVFAEEFKKPLLKLPEVSIIASDDRAQAFLDADVKAEEFDIKEEAPVQKEESSGFISSAFGRFNTQYYDLKQSVKLKNFYYTAKLNIKNTSGDRANTEVSLYTPSLILGFPFDVENEFIFSLDYFDKTMGLPGKTDNVTLDAKRRNSDLKLSGALEYNLNDLKLNLKPYYNYSILNNDVGLEDFRHKIVGTYLRVDFDNVFFDIDISENRLLTYYNQVVAHGRLRLESLDIIDNGKILAGLNLFAQEKFGQRPSPFVEFIYQEDEDFLHKFTITREFKPIIFNQTYLEDNYVQVDVNKLRPTRESSLAYQIDKNISKEWRTNALFYLKQTKDFWFWSDTDGDGLYTPEFMEKVNFAGIKLSTEYTWNQAFSHFFSINIQNNRSKDSAYEFVPLIPKQKISVGLTYKNENNFKIDFFGDYFSRRYYQGNSRESSSGYFLLSSKATYEPKDYLTIFVLIDNLLNDHYEIVEGYPNQSRSVMSGVMIKF
ncbi:MAG: hypothetical protein ABIG64_07940 [Candidatus Omnitrophota bacterium]